jgi:tetratricopeptide (TPR) repeat protein
MRISPLLLLLAGLALPAASAIAGDRQVILRTRDGRLVPGRVVAVDAKGVRHAAESGESFWPWEALTTWSQYEARSAAAPEDDGAARLELGRWALGAGLPGEARKQVLRARGLGAGTAEDLDALLARCDREQAERAFGDADRRAADGDLDGALDCLRSYLVQAPPSEWTDRGRERAADLVRRREAEEVRRREEEERLRKDAEEAKRAAAVADLLAEGDAGRTRAGILALVAIREEDGGSFTEFRRSLEKAEREYLDARRAYERARRLCGDERPVPERTARAGRNAVDGRLLDLYLRLARKFVDYKAWKDAQAALDKALRLDPVNAEGLELQDRVNKGWIRRKASGMTNTGGGSGD